MDDLLKELSSLGDEIRRDIEDDFGDRRYKIYLVITPWSGVQEFEGHEGTQQRVRLSPTPHILRRAGVKSIYHPGGVVPEGTILVKDLSLAQYTAGMLRGEGRKTNESFHWEVVSIDDGVVERYLPEYDIFSEVGEIGYSVFLQRMSD